MPVYRKNAQNRAKRSDSVFISVSGQNVLRSCRVRYGNIRFYGKFKHVMKFKTVKAFLGPSIGFHKNISWASHKKLNQTESYYGLFIAYQTTRQINS